MTADTEPTRVVLDVTIACSGTGDQVATFLIEEGPQMTLVGIGPQGVDVGASDGGPGDGGDGG